MNETAIVYIVHSDLDENNIFAMFEDEIEAIMYARRHKEDLTYVDKTEMSLDESGDYDEVLSAETIWVYDEEDDEEDELTDEEIEELIQADEDRKWAEADLGDTTWFEDLDTDKLVEALEENEDIVECKECFELFPKEACTKIAIGYVCPECGKVHGCCMDDEEEFEIDSIPDVVIADEDTFKIDFPELERTEYGNDMIPDEPTPEVENDPISEPEPMSEPCVGPECEAPVEAPVTKEETITKLVVDEHEAIDGYDKAKIEIEANSELDEKEKEEILDTIEHIKEEEVEHIEELEELVDEVEETKADEPTEEPEETEEHEVLTEGALTETIADIFSGIGNFFQKGVNAVKDFFVSGWNAVGGSKFALDDFYSPEGKYNTNKEHGNGYTVYGYNDKKEKVQQQKFNKLGKAYEYAVELSKALGKTALSVIEITDYKDEGKPILAIFKDGDVTDKTKDIILNKANTLSKELTQLDRQKAHQKKADELKNAETKKEEPKDDKKPDQETQTTSRYKANPISIKVGKTAPVVVKDTKAELDTNVSLKDCKVNVDKADIVDVIWNKKNNRCSVTGLKSGKVTLTITKGTAEICKCEVTVKVGNLSSEIKAEIEKAKELLGKYYTVTLESLTEHVNEEHPAIESDQKLVGTDNAVVDCKVNKVITHSEDEKPVDCKGEKKPFEKPLTEGIFDIFKKDGRSPVKKVDAFGTKLDTFEELAPYFTNPQFFNVNNANNAWDKIKITNSKVSNTRNNNKMITYQFNGNGKTISNLRQITDKLNKEFYNKELAYEAVYDSFGQLFLYQYKPFTESLTESLSKDQLQVMEEYLKSTKFASLETEWTDEGDFYIDECGAYLDYSAKTKTFTLGLSIYHASEDNNAEYPEDHTDEEEYSYDSLAEMYEDEECKEILDMLYEENEHDFTESLTEETHAKYAKPEGNRVQAFNNALKYAKKENKPFIYGYTNHTGKFFAAETPMKVTGSPAEAEKEFRQQYKNCKVVYVVYPDKEFIREGLFTKAEQEEYNMDEDGNSLDSYDTYIRCGFCDEIYTKSECKYERNLGWLCPRCEAAIYSRGEKLTFVDPDEFLD